MNNAIIKAVIFGCLFVSTIAKAQNPYMTKADVVTNFDVSANGQQLCCKWWGANGLLKIRVKNLSTQRVSDIDSISLSKTEALQFCNGITFLSDSVLLMGKNEALLSYNIKSREYNQLFALPDDRIQSITLIKDKKGLFLTGARSVYYADLKKGVQNSVATKRGSTIMSTTATADNQIICSVIVTAEGNDTIQLWSWDGQHPAVDLTSQFSEAIKKPYLVEATSSPDVYIVAGAEGVYRFDKSVQVATRILDNQKKDPIANLQISADDKTVYYQTFNQRALIKTMSMDGEQRASISMAQDYSPIAIVKNNEAMQLTNNGDISIEKTLSKKEIAKPLPTQREDGVYFIVDQLAEFPGGTIALQKYIAENFKCPAEYISNNKKDIILVGFVVAADVSVQEPVIKQSVDEITDNEVLRIISSMPKWIPAKVKGKNVAMVYNIPITF